MVLSDWEIGLIILSAIVYILHTVYVIRHPYIDLNDPSSKFSKYPFLLDSPTDRKDN